MPRAPRRVLPGLAYHITQRGVNRVETFSSDVDRTTYLKLLRQHRDETQVALLGWCLMGNHIHLVAVAEREDSLAVLLRRVHGRCAQYYNARTGRIGHLWQNRYFACPLGPSHLWIALSYVEQNPVRAGLAARAQDYPWSSAVAHVSGSDDHALLDMAWWAREGPGSAWAETLMMDAPDSRNEIQRCTYAGKPFGEQPFIDEISDRLGRHWVRGRPANNRAGRARDAVPGRQAQLFSR